ncbi:hypothetical protein HRI_003734800 [Hibiscus trionum]|uniref:Uncharacterized protein n=1 Tax=Hibiscus trionum TaxID=183268 RepID=A0A9W7MK77_HIBTR|nr:hypothetical protein HRI_003734800 [Hibiscus trionum]
MGNKADVENCKRKDWAWVITKYGRLMLKKMSPSPTDKTSSAPGAVCCEELFLPRKKGDCGLDPFVAAQIAAQNHFSLRPNINL